MAEAQPAVAFQFIVTPEGWNLKVDNHALTAVFMSGLRSWQKSLTWLQRRFVTGVYPATWASWIAVFFIILALQFADLPPTYHINRAVSSYFSSTLNPPLDFYLASSICASILWLTFVLVSRWGLWLLLQYQGFMFEAPGRGASLPTKLWAIILRLWAGSDYMLYSFQHALPKLPLPSLKETLRRHLRTMKPLCDDEKFANWERLSKEFERGIGRRLHLYLKIKSWWSSNWVTDWWEDYVYLANRQPLGFSSSFYGLDNLLYPMEGKVKPAARAANVVHAMLQFRRLIEHETLPPLLMRDTRPLCSAQYLRAFNTTRVPRKDKDKLRHINHTTHIAVNCWGKWYKMQCYYMGDLLRPCDLEKQFMRIMEDSNSYSVNESEARLPAVTNVNRDQWAEARSEFFSHGVNRDSLKAIEDAAFVVGFSSKDFVFKEDEVGSADESVQRALHGDGHTYWFDKSISVVFHPNSRVTANVEHSWADAPVSSQVFEYAFYHELRSHGYTLDGHTMGESNIPLPAPLRLNWDFTPKLKTFVDHSFQENESACKDVDLRLLYFKDFGKGFMKKARCSPDGFIQLALQLAYFRDVGAFHLTYEASMTRLYREGRTETVRSCTIESCDFVRAMCEDPKEKGKEELRKLLQKSVRTHQELYKDCMSGSGIDRHLFCLYVLAKYMKVNSEFLEEVISEKWRLSTSQTAVHQMLQHSVDWRQLHCGGGFNTVDSDGYGISYIIAGENAMFFHISSKFSSPKTDSVRFRNNVQKALCDMKELFTA